MEEIQNYQDYLELKLKVDYRCMNRHVFSAFKQRLTENASILDLGTGTGLMIRKIISTEPSWTLAFCGIDRDEASCAAARVSIEKELKRHNYRTYTSGGACVAEKDETRLTVTITHGDFLTDAPNLRDTAYQFVTAHAFMDLVPLGKTIDRIRAVLVPGGFFYSSINYDGVTTFLPLFEDDDFERTLLELYNGSMNRRTEADEPTGGDRAGSRLYHELHHRAFTVIDFGSSDWVVFPKNRSYQTYELRFLKYLLRMVYQEVIRQGGTDREELNRWYTQRLSDIDSGRLVLITHQTDILARRA